MDIVRRSHCTDQDGFVDGPIGPYTHAFKQCLIQRRYAAKTVVLYHRKHTTAMHLLQVGVPFNVIALWLGHESPTTTHRYLKADLAMKEKALGHLEAPDARFRRYQAPDSLMRFLQAL